MFGRRKRALRRKLETLDPVTGKTRPEILDVLGPPQLVRLDLKDTDILGWGTDRFLVQLAFDADGRCLGFAVPE